MLRMEMIAGVECCQDVRRTVRSRCRCVEVDHAVMPLRNTRDFIVESTFISASPPEFSSVEI
jgi:hypothetical protein